MSAETGLLLVWYGSTSCRALEDFRAVERQFGYRFSSCKVMSAMSSSRVRQKLQEEGKKFLSVREGCKYLRTMGCTSVVVQSLHLIPGEEWDQVKKDLTPELKHTRVHFSPPLLIDELMVNMVALSMIRESCASGYDAVIWMGHGSFHPEHQKYRMLNDRLQVLNGSHCLGTMDAEPSLQTVMLKLKTRKSSRVLLRPFLFVSGEHVIKDMCGGEDSWQKILEKNGFEVKCETMPLCRRPAFLKYWIQSAQAALEFL